ncbi:MAG: glycosyl hydrolase family 18 protein [Flavobacteriales bacterium]
MKKINYYLTFGFALLAFGLFAQNKKVIGYFPSYRSTTDVSAQCDKLTDIIFSFINPNTDGTLITNNPGDALYGFDMNKYTVVRDAANNKGTNLWLSLGGADPGEQRAARLSSVCQNSTFRNNLATALVNFATNSSTSCYGLSIDWEFPKDPTAITAHKDFMILLDQKIAASSNPNLKVAVAVGGETKNTVNHTKYIDPSFFNTNAGLVDEWHIMAYDFPSGNNYDVTNHASYNDANSSMVDWNALGVPYNKMYLGVPFYARGTSNRSSEAMYRDWTPSNTIYTSDVNGSYGYNGINTLKSKIDLVVNKGAAGILIWDLGQDLAPSHQYSLLAGIDTYLSTLCNIPKPNMGPDKGICAPNTVTLDPGVATASGRTFAWYKDNALQGGQTGTTFTASAAGTYKVVISQGSGCTKEDEIVIVAGAPFSTSGANGCAGTSLTLSITNPVGGKTYDWYDAAVSGTKVGTGTTLTQVFNTNTTYYAEEKAAGVNTYTSPIATYSDVTGASFWTQTTAEYRAQRIAVTKDLTIKFARVYVSHTSGATFRIKVSNSSNNSFVAQSPQYTYGTKTSTGDGYDIQDVPVDITLTPGDYFIYVELTSGAIGFSAMKGAGFAQSGVFDIEKNSYTDFNGATGGAVFSTAEKTDVGAHVHYGCLYKFVIETGANASCGRTPATATVVTCGPPAITITKPTNNQNFDYAVSIDLQATVTDEGSVASVSFEIWDGVNKIATLTPGDSGSTYSSTWTPTTYYPSRTYTLKVIATDNSSNSSNSSVNFNVISGVSVNELAPVTVTSVNLFPNPSNSNLNINVSAVKVGLSTITVYDLAGRVMFNNVQNLSAGENLSTIDVSSLAAGSYLLNVSVNGETVNKTFSVVK